MSYIAYYKQIDASTPITDGIYSLLFSQTGPKCDPIPTLTQFATSLPLRKGYLRYYKIRYQEKEPFINGYIRIHNPKTRTDKFQIRYLTEKLQLYNPAGYGYIDFVICDHKRHRIAKGSLPLPKPD